MRIVLSRKGVDSAAGRCASPILGGRCVSIPIPVPANYPSNLRYQDLGLPAPVEDMTGGALANGDKCHADPAFVGGRAALGQVDAAQSHLENQGVGVGDVFLFFGVFQHEGRRAHRIFGYLRVEERRILGRNPQPDPLIGLPWPHPHTEGDHWPDNNTVYIGWGATFAPAHEALCLTHPDGALTRWRVPAWMARLGLSYHTNPVRWETAGELQSVARGQEFVCDIGDDPEALAWLNHTIARIEH